MAVYKYHFSSATEKEVGVFFPDEVEADNDTKAMKAIRKRMRERNAGILRKEKRILREVFRVDWVRVYRNGRP